MNTPSSTNINNKTYFISDLHLDPLRPHLFKLFHDFVEKIRDDAKALYILGDLFEFWIGDDIIDSPIGKPYLPVIEQLRSLSDQGVEIYFIQGNRDFLIGKKFMQSIGGKLLPDHQIIDLYGTKILLMHGDTLCTDDKGYQLMRKIFRLWIVQKIYLSMSPEKRSQKAGQVRKKTSQSIKQKSETIMDVNQLAVEKCIKSGGVSFLIHGHTHRPAVHDVLINSKQNKRIVLGDWGEKWSYLEWTAAGNYQLNF